MRGSAPALPIWAHLGSETLEYGHEYRVILAR